MTGPKVLMVNKTSAERIGHLARDIEHLPSHSDHRGLVRFNHSRDDRSISLIENVRGMAERAQNAVDATEPASKESLPIYTSKSMALNPFSGTNHNIAGASNDDGSLSSRLRLHRSARACLVREKDVVTRRKGCTFRVGWDQVSRTHCGI